MIESKKVAPSVVLGKMCRLGDFVNLYGCTIGDETKIGPFVEIQKNAFIGKRCKIQSHTFICEGVTIETKRLSGTGLCSLTTNIQEQPRIPVGFNRGGLEGCPNGDQAARLDRVKCHDYVWCHSG